MNLTARTIPSRIADLGFTAPFPADWIAHELPEEAPDFADPSKCFPLALLTAPYAAIVFAAAARPAYEDGTLHDWAWYLLGENGLQPRAIGPVEIAGVPGMAGEAVQDSELGRMVVRFAFLEDGGRLINLSLTAPEPLADSVRSAWFSLLSSFTLESPRGSRFTGGADLAPSPAPAAASEATATPAPDAEPEACTFARYALADTADTLDPEHPVNAGMRDRGAGLVPRVAAIHDAEKRATVGLGSITCFCDVPFGWHIVDDGRRAVVLDPGGAIQINLSLLPLEGRSTAEVLDSLEAQMRQDYPHPEFCRLELGKIHALGARNIADGAQPLEQYHMLYPSLREGMILRARVTTIPDRRTDACNLAELMLQSCTMEPPQAQAAPAPAPAPARGDDGQPAWQQKAASLEAAGELEEAERVIRDGCPHLSFACITAEMYLHRMVRLKEAGDAAGALTAFRKAVSFIHLYASLATSGGEGMALSAERDSFRRRLVATYGSDPEA